FDFILKGHFGNKENAEPAHGSKSFIKRSKTSGAPLQLQSNETVAKNGLKAKPKQAGNRSVPAEALKQLNTMQNARKGAAATDVKPRQTYSRAFLTEQAVKNKILNEATKPRTNVPSSKPALGMYKGKIVQSKIGSIWKSSASVGAVDPKASAAKTGYQRVGNVTQRKSKSVSDLPGRGTQKPASAKSFSSRPAQVSKAAVTSHPPVRTIPATLTSTSSRNTTVATTNGSRTDKINRPPISSTLSQYRFTMETKEERRAKLSEWKASKGKTLKRPAMTTVAPPKTKVSAKPEADLKSQPHAEPKAAAQYNPEPEHSLEAQKLDSSAAAHCVATHNQTPVIMNTTLVLLENSDDDLPFDPQDGIVVNLCDALEAMVTPSRCSGELAQVADECHDVEMDNPKDKSKKEMMTEMSGDVGKWAKVEQVKNGEDSGHEVEVDDQEVESDDKEDVTTTQEGGASVVRYSVKTTPYLESVKKAIGEARPSTSRRKSNIKDLKFLTPVRRSCRIQCKSSQLPSMLVDHDACVSSLAELVRLDDSPNAYIYRKNPALLEDLPDQTGL
uniref:Cytoskeleton-associated protein 2 C-terminal domain-containing protein n=1 Tax=Monopterus albus TaxID=43700 RepID=A0A3Q3Q3Z6_MONAL